MYTTAHIVTYLLTYLFIYLDACSVASSRNANLKVEHQRSEANNVEDGVEHQQDEEALRASEKALAEKFNKLEDL